MSRVYIYALGKVPGNQSWLCRPYPRRLYTRKCPEYLPSLALCFFSCCERRRKIFGRAFTAYLVWDTAKSPSRVRARCLLPAPFLLVELFCRDFLIGGGFVRVAPRKRFPARMFPVIFFKGFSDWLKIRSGAARKKSPVRVFPIGQYF